jgi:hypothetical protein
MPAKIRVEEMGEKSVTATTEGPCDHASKTHAASTSKITSGGSR